jgi:hypothetical protein
VCATRKSITQRSKTMAGSFFISTICDSSYASILTHFPSMLDNCVSLVFFLCNCRGEGKVGAGVSCAIPFWTLAEPFGSSGIVPSNVLAGFQRGTTGLHLRVCQAGVTRDLIRHWPYDPPTPATLCRSRMRQLSRIRASPSPTTEEYRFAKFTGTAITTRRAHQGQPSHQCLQVGSTEGKAELANLSMVP